MTTHYEVQSHLCQKYNEAFNTRYYHGIYRVVKMVGDDVIQIIETFDSPNGGWNYNQAMELCGELVRETTNDNRE